MENLKTRIINQIVKGISYYYVSKSLLMIFDSGFSTTFTDCELVTDLGIIGEKITFVSDKGTLGITLELQKHKIDPTNYNFLIISKNINDHLNKSEMIIVYKTYSILE